MPTTYNGIGTTYFRRRNRFTRQGVCEFCRRFSTLTSYDTTLVFSIFFIPVIPLGRKHIADQCAQCTRHRVLKTEDWQRLRQSAVQQIATFEAAPQPTEDDFKNAMASVLHAQQPAALPRITARSRQVMLASADRELFIGEVFRRFGDLDSAEASYKRALSMRDDAQTNAAMAKMHLARGKVDDARKSLRHVLEGKDADNVALALALAHAYQADGRHAEALAIFETVAKVSPETAADKNFVKSRLASEKAGFSGKRVKARTLVAADGSLLVAPPSRWRGLAIFGGIAAAAAVGYCVWSIVAAHRRAVYLVGAIDRAYKVQIDGETYDVPRQGEAVMHLAEGPHTVTMIDSDYLVEPARPFTVPAANFFTRPFTKQALAINADGAAVLVNETVMYGASVGSNGIRPDLHAGQLFYALESIDYPFEAPPSSISVNSGSGDTFRHYLYTLRPAMKAADLIQAARTTRGDAAALAVTQHLLRDLRNNEIISTIPRFLPPSELLPILKERAQRQPTNGELQDLIRVLEHPTPLNRDNSKEAA